jgi:hypothetical protein
MPLFTGALRGWDAGYRYGPNTVQVEWLLAALPRLGDDLWAYVCLSDIQSDNPSDAKAASQRISQAAERAWGRRKRDETLRAAAKDAQVIASRWWVSAATSLRPGLQRLSDERRRARGLRPESVDKVVKEKAAGIAAMLLVLRPVALAEDFELMWTAYEPALSVLREQRRRPLMLGILRNASNALAIRASSPQTLPFDPTLVAGVAESVAAVARTMNDQISTAQLDRIVAAANRVIWAWVYTPGLAADAPGADKVAWANIAQASVLLSSVDELYLEGAQYLDR